MTAIDTVVRRHSEHGTAAPELPSPVPTLHLVVLTCMDARIDPAAVFDLRPGEAHVLRNAGGIVTEDVLRSLAISQRKLDTREVLVMQHTTCGMTTVTDEGFKDELEQATGLRPTWSVEAFREVAASVRQSVERARRSPFLADVDHVRGFVYDVTTGGVAEVD